MKNNKGPGAFYITIGWVLGCYSSLVSYFQYRELGLWILCILGTLGLLAGVLYYHSKQNLLYSQTAPKKPKENKP